MKKSLKCASIIAAALFAVSPVVVSGNSIFESTVVKAADSGEPDPNAIKLVFGSKKKYLTLQPYSMWGDIKNDITVNHGKVNIVFNVYTYKKGKNGKVDYNTPVKEYELKKGDEGVIVAELGVDGLDDNKNYTFLNKVDDSGNLVWVTKSGAEEQIAVPDANPATKIPFVVGSKVTKKSSTTKVNKRGYVTARKNRKVRTYTSTGKFSKHYVYGHHTYRLNRKKTINKHGTCYKIYGKNQWIPAKYLKF